MICWKIRIFAYWTTPEFLGRQARLLLWFAEKFVSLLIEQHRKEGTGRQVNCCDLLKNSYLCLLNNTITQYKDNIRTVVICWKIRIFAYWTTPEHVDLPAPFRLWFAEKFVSLLIEQHPEFMRHSAPSVVICWKIRIFAYWTTPDYVEVAQYESVVSNDRNGKNPMLEGRDLNKREVSSFLLIYLHALSFSMKRRNWV